MSTGGICPERDRLLRVVTDLSHAYADRAMLVACSAGQNDHAAFLNARRRAQEMHDQLVAARQEYQWHIEHSCERCAGSSPSSVMSQGAS